jgi:hypothetical protein
MTHSMKEILSDVVKVNAPNIVTIGVINLSDIQAAATLVLTLLSISSTCVLLWRQATKKDREGK